MDPTMNVRGGSTILCAPEVPKNYSFSGTVKSRLKSKWFIAFMQNFRHLIYLRKPRRIENAPQNFRPKFLHLGLIYEDFVKNIFLSKLYVTSVQFEWTCITEPISSRSKSGDFLLTPFCVCGYFSQPSKSLCQSSFIRC